MLKEGDEDKPVVYPEVRHEVDTEHLFEATRHGPRDKPNKPQNDADVRNDDLAVLVGRKERLARGKVWTIIQRGANDRKVDPYG